MNKHSIVLPKRDNNGQREDIALDLLKRIVGDASKKFGRCNSWCWGFCWGYSWS